MLALSFTKNVAYQNTLKQLRLVRITSVVKNNWESIKGCSERSDSSLAVTSLHLTEIMISSPLILHSFSFPCILKSYVW